jgi:hypothetical protein
MLDKPTIFLLLITLVQKTFVRATHFLGAGEKSPPNPAKTRDIVAPRPAPVRSEWHYVKNYHWQQARMIIGNGHHTRYQSSVTNSMPVTNNYPL